ncbi:T9SS type A sorting domain-containing protein [uncultured Bacteroides sp.]|uniref:T9SS type A sorting domain-containing protein n=1 Tax=uncultured Bacteroides sp. TaxID=162156 RepID=UPI002AA7D25B|nr:T9SS type A sorting domain-containing protein [uncultured Bacteroides sp.]
MKKKHLLGLILILSVCFISQITAQKLKRSVSANQLVSNDTLAYTDFNSKPGAFTTGDVFTASTSNANKEKSINSIVFGSGPNGQRINLNASQSANQFGSASTTYVSASAVDDGANAGAFSFLKSGTGAGGGYIIMPQVQGPADVTIWSCGANTSSQQKYIVYFSTDDGGTWIPQDTCIITTNKLIYKNIYSYSGTGNLKVKITCATSSSSNCNLYIYDVLITKRPSIIRTSEAGTDNQTVSLGQSISNIAYSWGSIATSASVSWIGTADTNTPPNGLVVTTDNAAKMLTISGTPTVAGSYGFNVISTNGTIFSDILSAKINVVATPIPLINQISESGTQTQKVMTGNVMTNLAYKWGGSATSASIIWTGTVNPNTPPDGISIAVDKNLSTLTISGTPTTAGSYGCTITSTDGTQTSTPLTATLAVIPPPSIVLTSAAATTSQVVSFSQSISNIVYALEGSATTANISWTGTSNSTIAPAGVKVVADNDAKTLTISGAPMNIGSYGFKINAIYETATSDTIAGVIKVGTASNMLPSFPGAVGFGSHATGGRGGTVYHVTNLNDSGEGSLRDAVSVSNRIIVFDVSGYISLTSAISAKSNLTIAGQTAPGEGIAIKSGELSFAKSSNVICRHIRVRPGSETESSGDDALSLYLANNVILDHCSFEFAPWNNIDGVSDNTAVSPVTNITFQSCIIANPTGQQFGAHCESVGSNWTFYKNIFANSHNRNPLAKINDTYANNVLYNCSAGYTTHSGTSFKHDIVNNYFVFGPASTGTDNSWFQVDNNQSIYCSGNMKDMNLDGVLNGAETTPYWYQGGGTVLTSPWTDLTNAMPIYSAATAFRIAASTAGTLPYDQTDSLIINQVKTIGSGTTGYVVGTTGPDSGLYTSQAQTGLDNNGYGLIRSGNKDLDTDNDGMPDYWEKANGSDVNVNDAMQIASDGYTLIEHYINWLAEFHAVANSNASLDIDLLKYLGGFSSVSPTFTINECTNGTATIQADGHTVRFNPSSDFTGIANIKFTIAGNDDTSYSSSISVVVTTTNKSTSLIANPIDNISIYPNPTSKLLMFTNTDGGAFEVYDTLGCMLLKGQTTQFGAVQQVDVSKLHNGIYILKVQADGKKINFRFIKRS